MGASLSNYWVQDGDSYTLSTTPIETSSTNTVFYVNALIDDTNALANDSSTVTFDYGSVTDATLSNQSFGYFVRRGDTVRMSWTTSFKSAVEDFTNVFIYGISATPTSTDGLSWTAEVVIPQDGVVSETHSLTYLGNVISIDATNVKLDVEATTFSLVNTLIQTDSITMKLTNVADAGYSTQSVPVGINNTFTVNFTLTKDSDSSVINYPL